MHRLLKPKNINRFGVALALFAPIVYLFGTQFMALVGAHGNSGLSADYEVVTDTFNVDFNQLFHGRSISHRGINLVYSDGYYTVSGTADGQAYVNLNDYNINVKANHTYIIRNLASSSGNYYCYVSSPYVNLSNEYNRWTPTVSANNVYYALTVSSGFSFSSPITFCCQWFDLTQMYGFGNEPSIDVFLEDFGDSYYPYTLSEDKVVTRSAVPTYSQYLFNQFFPKGNFLEQWGFNALSENPVGFAPFSALFRFLDANMLHLGDLNIGLMAYGYIYYCAHVLIFDLVLYMAVFFLRFIKAVVDRWEVSR